MEALPSGNHYILDLVYAGIHYTNYLVQAVVVTTVVWLFGSGLIVLIGASKYS